MPCIYTGGAVKHTGQHSEESSVKLGDMRHCLSLVNEKSFPSALVDIFNLEVKKQDQIFWKASLVSIFVLISLRWEVKDCVLDWSIVLFIFTVIDIDSLAN